MRNSHRLAIVLASGALAGCAARPAPPAEGRAARLAGHPGTRAHEIACDLADRVGPRLAGSAGDAAARAWALERMRALGLANIREEPVLAPHWERGPISLELLLDGARPVPLTALALGGSVATPEEGITAPVVRASSIEALVAMADERVRGRIVYFDKPMERIRDGFASYANAVDVRTRGPAAAAAKGAAAVVIRSIATSDARFAHTGGTRFGDGPRIPAAALAVPDANTLTRLLAKGEAISLRLRLAATQRPDVETANVMGEVRGREKPDEIVLLGAHLDSWDVGPGAVDDAAGVGVVLEVARLLLADPPRRTVRIVLFANEENGLRGAYAYAEAHAAELEAHQAALEIDGGAGEAWFLVWRAGDGAERAMKRLEALLAPLGVEGAGRDDDAGGADLIPLTRSGVPALELKQDARRYFDLHHTADDTCDKIDPASLAQVTAVAAMIARELAEIPGRLPFANPPE